MLFYQQQPASLRPEPCRLSFAWDPDVGMENRALAVQRFDPGEDRRLWEEIQSGEGEARRAIVDLPRIPFGV
jgi:hypothetical protein